MKRITGLIVFVAVLSGCSTPAPPAPPSPHIPVAMSCPGSLDPNQGCPNPSEPVAKLVNPRAEMREEVDRTITGRCELSVEGDKSVRPCTEVKLELKSMVGEETRQALVDGYNFRVPDLTKVSYRVVATSEKFQLSTDNQPLQAGQIVKIRIKAKPLPQ